MGLFFVVVQILGFFLTFFFVVVAVDYFILWVFLWVNILFASQSKGKKKAVN